MVQMQGNTYETEQNTNIHAWQWCYKSCNLIWITVCEHKIPPACPRWAELATVSATIEMGARNRGVENASRKLLGNVEIYNLVSLRL